MFIIFAINSTRKMELKNTDIINNPIIFGTSALGNLYSELDEITKTEIIKECFTYSPKPVIFDCAGKYGAGLALEMLGKCLTNLNIAPEDVIISNKLGWYRVPLVSSEPTFEKGVWINIKNDAVQCISYDGILKCWEQGNNLLGKYIPQLVSVHDPDEYLAASDSIEERKKRFNDILDAYKALEELKALGKVKAIGIGSKDWCIIKELEKYVNFDWVMFANSYTIYSHPAELYEFMQTLSNKGVSIINSAVFHSGFLTGSNYFDYQLINPSETKYHNTYKWRNGFFDLCKKFDIAPAHVCVHYARSAKGVASIALNTSNPKRVKENIEMVQKPVPIEFYIEMKNLGLLDKLPDNVN